ncbi:MAG: omptin family outer membrane protease [Candidatus Omnitrophica bacterium]|nr:omptin family outer membrane protease [Candidatus Omnitrophota bacterium]
MQKTTWGDIFADVIGHYPLADSLTTDNTIKQKNKLNTPKNWEFGIEAKRYIASNTSYEFGDPGGAFTKPLSRLEFPINTWWLNFDLRRTCPRWSVGAKAGFSMNRNSNGWMEDSDWATSGSDNILTNYSRSYCDIRKAFLFRGDVDVNISDWLRLPSSLEIRPLFAFQFQRFNPVAHNGVQWNYDDGSAMSLDGNAISFRQDWYTYMIGMRGAYSLDLNKHIAIKLKTEADWGPALGHNEDHHILRGDRWTYENTSGNALYFLAGVDMTISKTITIGAGIDYLWIQTFGTHRWRDPSLPVDQSWSDGVKAWSDQLGLTMHASYAF